MAKRKSRLQEVSEVTAPAKPAEPAPRYRDAFQRTSERRIEDITHKMEGKGRTLLYALGALVVLAILIGIFISYQRRANAAAQAALGKAIETSTARVTDLPVPAGSTEKVFKTEKERADAAIAEFQAVAEKYGSPVREKAQYFIAVNRLSVDRAAGIAELENLAKQSGEIGTLSKFALAQAKASEGKHDEAAAIYLELSNASDSIIPKDTINFNLAKVYERQGKKDQAADLYYIVAKNASEAKDAEGKPIQMTQTGSEARERLEELNPAKAAEIKDTSMPTIPGPGNESVGPGGERTFTF
jgi:predicted negative regulator of RcsB-dependent stress response